MALKWLKRIVAALIVLAVVAGLVYALRPQPVAVDLATLDRGPMEVTIDEEGIARIRDVFVVSAPITGRVERLPVDVGDKVVANQTVVASIHPVQPSFLDVRTRRELAGGGRRGQGRGCACRGPGDERGDQCPADAFRSRSRQGAGRTAPPSRSAPSRRRPPTSRPPRRMSRRCRQRSTSARASSPAPRRG